MFRKLSDIFKKFGRSCPLSQEGARFVREYESGLIRDEDIVAFKVGFDATAQKLSVRAALQFSDGDAMEYRQMRLSLNQAHAIVRATSRRDIVREVTHGYDLARIYYNAALSGEPRSFDRD